MEQIFRPMPNLCGHKGCGPICLTPTEDTPKGVNYKDHFELRYLRWDYMVRVKNVPDAEIQKHSKTIRKIADDFLGKHAKEVRFHGMGLEDIENISRCYAMVYLSKYSLTVNKTARDAFVAKNAHKAMDKDSLNKKDIANMMSFIQQRLSECAYVFRQKAATYAGFSTKILFEKLPGGIANPSDVELIDRPASIGWKKVSWSSYVKIRAKLTGADVGAPFKVAGRIFTMIYTPNGFAEENDAGFLPVVDRLRSKTLTPEESMILKEEHLLDLSNQKKYFTHTPNLNLNELVDKIEDDSVSLKEKTELVNGLISALSETNQPERVLAAKELLKTINKKRRNGSNVKTEGRV